MAKTQKEKSASVSVPWWEAQVCPVTRRPWDTNGFCWACGGYHQVPSDRACAVCGGTVREDGFCKVCLNKGGGIGYEILKSVVADCHGADCGGEVHGPHTNVWLVYECVGVPRWLSREETAQKCRELIETVFGPKQPPPRDKRWAERVLILRSRLKESPPVGLGGRRNLARQSGFLESQLDAALQEAREVGR